MYASTKAARRLLLERLTKVVAELKRRACQGHRALRGVVATRTSACCSSTHPRLPAARGFVYCGRVRNVWI